MEIRLATVLMERQKRGPEFLTEVLKAGHLDKGQVTIDERRWLIACDRWPDDPAGLSAGGSLETKCC